MKLEEYQIYFINAFAREWPSMVHFKNQPYTDEMSEWTKENCSEEVMCLPIDEENYLYCFKNDEDATVFKLRWLE